MSMHEIINLISVAHIQAILAQNGIMGLGIIALIIFCETGLVFAPFLPGDSLLFASGTFLAASGISLLPAWLLIAGAAILGDAVNYSAGRSALGQYIINKKLLKPAHVVKTHHYFQRYGAATVFIGRFIPVVRTLAPFLAGTSKMPVRTFVVWNILGGMSWSAFFLGMGYFLGRLPWVQTHMTWMLGFIIVCSLLPVLFQWGRKPLGSK